jgi:hypothetical protein
MSSSRNSSSRWNDIAVKSNAAATYSFNRLGMYRAKAMKYLPRLRGESCPNRPLALYRAGLILRYCLEWRPEDNQGIQFMGGLRRYRFAFRLPYVQIIIIYLKTSWCHPIVCKSMRWIRQRQWRLGNDSTENLKRFGVDHDHEGYWVSWHHKTALLGPRRSQKHNHAWITCSA